MQLATERIIYNLLTTVSGWAAELLPRVEQEVITGQADVLQVCDTCSSLQLLKVFVRSV